MTVEEVLYKTLPEALRTLNSLYGETIAEDALQHASLKACENWDSELPNNPVAWLVSVGKNYALNELNKTSRNESLDILGDIQADVRYEIPADLIADNGLRQIFACCDSNLSTEEKRSIALSVVVSLSQDAIARALIQNKAAINKRITRAKGKISSSGSAYPELGNDEIEEHLELVMEIIFIIAREAYLTTNSLMSVSHELTFVSIDLARSLVELRPLSNECKGLLALVLLWGGWVDARMDDEGNIKTLVDVDRKLWKRELINEAVTYLEPVKDFESIELDNYQTQAHISYYFSKPDSFLDTDWVSVELLYQRLEVVYPSLGTSMMHAVALFYRFGKDAAWKQIAELESNNWEQLVNNTYFYALKGHIYEWSQEYNKAIKDYRKAIDLSKNAGEIKYAEEKIKKLSLNRCKRQ